MDSISKVLKKAWYCRAFEQKVFSLIQEKKFDFPIYLSAGQELIPATFSSLLKGGSPAIFGQHRGHSTYLCYGGNPSSLITELLGREVGCANGMGGSASIQSKEAKMFGHDGLMGSQVPIAVGYALSSRSLTVCIMGDASAEEDYVLSSIALAVKKRLPIVFVVEANNLCRQGAWEGGEFFLLLFVGLPPLLIGGLFGFTGSAVSVQKLFDLSP